jgi:hypothetical protein
VGAINRRDLVKMTALALCAPELRLGALRLGSPTEPHIQADTESAYEWIRGNRTLIAEAYNPPFYPSFDYVPAKAVSIATDLNCDSMRYPAASYFAYFPSKSGYPVHPDLRGDPMRESLRLLRQADLRTIAYIPLNHPFMDVRFTDPKYDDWMKRYANGSPMITEHYGFNRYHEGCLNSPIRNMIRGLTLEVLAYDFDVLYFDGPYQGMDHSVDWCYCSHCQEAYRKRFGKDVPDQKTASIDEQAQYIAWMRDEVAIAFFHDIRELIRSTRDVPVLFNDTSLLSKGEQWRSRAIPVADGFMFEAADTPEEKLFNLQLGKSTGKVTWTYIGSHTEYNREHMKDKHARGWFSYPVEGQELLLDGAVATAAGVGCVYWGMQRFFYEPEAPLAYDSGRYVKEIYDLQQKHHELLRTLSSRPQVGILVSDQTINWYQGAHFVPAAYGNYYHGAFNLLKSLSIESEPFLDWAMTPALLERYSMIFAPNAVCLSDAQCAMLRQYVQQGGTLVATHMTSVCDELGRPRQDFGLSDVFGASFDDAEPFEFPDLYVKPASGDLVPQDSQIMRVRATTCVVTATTLDRGNHRSLGPATMTHRTGKGNCLYLASGLEAIFEETRMDSVRSYLASLLMPHLQAQQTYTMDYIPGVIPHYMRSDQTIMLHLLADIGDKVQHLKVRDRFFPVDDVTVRLRVQGAVKAASLLRAGTKVETKREGEWVTVTVPRVLVYEAVQLDLG